MVRMRGETWDILRVFWHHLRRVLPWAWTSPLRKSRSDAFLWVKYGFLRRNAWCRSLSSANTHSVANQRSHTISWHHAMRTCLVRPVAPDRPKSIAPVSVTHASSRDWKITPGAPTRTWQHGQGAKWTERLKTFPSALVQPDEKRNAN